MVKYSTVVFDADQGYWAARGRGEAEMGDVADTRYMGGETAKSNVQEALFLVQFGGHDVRI